MTYNVLGGTLNLAQSTYDSDRMRENDNNSSVNNNLHVGYHISILTLAFNYRGGLICIAFESSQACGVWN